MLLMSLMTMKWNSPMMMKMNKLSDITLFIDDREQSTYPFFVLTSYGVTIERKRLDEADYILTNGDKIVYIELKIGGDLISSMYDKRLSEQLTKLSMKEFSILAFVGQLYDVKMMTYLPSNLQNPQTVVSIATSVALKKGDNRVGFVQYETMEQFELGLYYIARKLHKDLRTSEEQFYYNEEMIGYKSSDKKYGVTDEEQIKKIQVATLMRIPRLGYKTAVVILEHFNYDFQYILFVAEEKELKSVKGVGPKIVDWIYRIYRGAVINE